MKSFASQETLSPAQTGELVALCCRILQIASIH